MSAFPIVVDLDTYTRKAELLEYASRRNIDVADAIRELVNTGLSHQ